MTLIETGGPFPYKRDGIIFGNFEKLLPFERRGYYREYTVPTPGLRHRGARRIVCGGWEVRRPDACYYTADHYRSFRKIAQDTTR
jgi:ribonuclease T1